MYAKISKCDKQITGFEVVTIFVEKSFTSEILCVFEDLHEIVTFLHCAAWKPYIYHTYDLREET